MSAPLIEGAETVTETSTEPATTDAPTPIQLPDDHPLVKTLTSQKATIRELKTRIDAAGAADTSAADRLAAAEERLAETEAEAATVPAKVCDALRSLVVDLELVDADAAEFLTATDPDTLVKQLRFVMDRAGSGRRTNIVAREGHSPQPKGPDATREFLRSLNGGGQG